jgi:pimeloyl-ACP methyl ester carboxylesterase
MWIASILMLWSLFTSDVLAAFSTPAKPFTTPDGKLSYHQMGNGSKTILLLGGGPGFSSWNLEPIQRMLSSGYRVLLLDMRGIGENKMSVVPNEVLLKKWVSDLERLRQHSKSETWTLIGHSWGALMAQRYAQQHPKSIEQLVLLNPVDPQTDSLKPLVERIEQKRLDNTPAADPFSDAAWQHQTDTPNQTQLAQQKLSQALPSYFYNYAQGVQYAQQFNSTDFEPAINVGIWKAYQQQPIRPQALRQLAMQFPIFIMGCDEDLLSPENIANYQKILPKVPVKQLKQCAHFPWVEQPEAFEQQLLAFLQEEADFSPAQRAQWFDTAGLLDSQAALSVSKGTLGFVDAAKIDSRFDYNMTNKLHFLPNSLMDGWLSLTQCHYNLDPVKALEIVYAQDKTRKLNVISQQHIGSAKAEGNRVELRDIQGSAHVCISAETKGLEQIAHNQWQLKRGPFMRRYLDGYYPMQASLEVDWSDMPLHLINHYPSEQMGVQTNVQAQSFRATYRFEGQLSPQLLFEQQAQ